MGKQPKKRHIIPVIEPAADLSDELRSLVEKRVADRRAKSRRGGPPRRSLNATSRDSDKGGAVPRPAERRKKERRQPAERRGKPRRR